MPQAAVAVASYIYGAVGTAAAAAGASSAAASAIATAAVGVASATAKVALLAGLNAVVAQQNKPRPQGGLISLTINPNEPRRLQIGTRVNGGVLVDWYVTGTKNQRLFMVVYLGEGPMGRILKVIGGGREVYTTPINHGTRTTIPNYRSGGDRLWITYYDGRPGQTADATLTALSLGWTSACVGTGCAYAIIEALWDSDNQTSPPSISFEMEGAKLYDRRLDGTAGGTGSHRANDPATWALSSNPAVALDHFLLGRYTGSIKTFGVGLAATDVPYAAFAARANLADEDVDRKVSGTLKRYAANGFLFADRTYSDTIRDLCRAMNARPADFGGRIGIIDGEEKTPVLTIADTDLIEGVPETYTPKRSWADLVSVVRGTYQNPAQLYQAGEYPRVTDAAWTAADGGSPKEATLDLEMEIDVERAQRLALLHARRERRQAQLTGTYELRTIELEQGDWFTRTGGIFGAGKTFEVIDRVLDPATLHVTITAFEVDPADSAWDEDVAADAPPAAIANTNSLEAMEVPALTVTGVTLSGTTADIPAIKVVWTAPTDPRVRQIVIEAVPTGGGVPTSAQVDYATGQVVFTSGITDDTDYLVRARFVGQFIPSAWSSNIAVTTLGDFSLGAATSVPWSGVTGPGRPDDDADVTAANTAAGIAGQGAFATLNSAAYGSSLLTGFGALAPLAFTTLGSNVRLADGTTVATNALVVTSLGTASAISGQGGLATLSFVQFNSNVRLQNGTTIVTDVIVVTSVGTAAAITGQGPGATAAGDLVLNLHANYGVRKGFNFQTTLEGVTASGTLTWVAGVARWVSTASDQQLFATVDLAGRLIPKVRMRLRPTSASFSWEGVIYYSTPGHSFSGSYYNIIGAPSGLAQNVWVIAEWDMTSLSAGGTDWISSTINGVRFDISNGSGETWEIDWIAFGDFGPDPVGIRGIQDDADVTAANTAAGIAGQGGQATANHYRGATYPGTPTEGSWWADTSASVLKLYTGGAWQNVATLSTAVQTRGKIIGPGAVNFSANNAWEVAATVDVSDVPTAAVIQALYVEVIGQSQSAATIGSGYSWRITEAQTSSPSTKTVIKTGGITISAGSGSDPPTVDDIVQPTAALVTATKTGSVRYTIEVQRTSGSATIGLQLTANIIVGPS